MNEKIQRRSRRRRVSVLLMVLGVVLFGLSSFASSPAGSTVVPGQASDESSGQIRILTVSGLIDPVMADFITTELKRAEADAVDGEVIALVLAIDSKGSVLDDEAFTELAELIATSPLQIVGWVGPSGSVALGGSAELVGLTDLVGVSAGSRIGDIGEPRLPEGAFEAPFGAATERLESVSIDAEEAIELGISVGPIERASVLRDFVNEIEGYRSPALSDDVSQLTQAQFLNLPITAQLFHTVASPEVSYLFFVGGLALLVFELFTAGVGIAGVIGAFMLVLGSYGLDVLPTRWWAIALLILALMAMAVDIQTNVPRLYSAVGLVLFVLGTWFLFKDGVSMSWITGLFGIVGAVLYVYTGMPSMVRTRFSTPTIGRKWMIGQMGTATSSVDPTGTVVIDDTPWRAVTNRATPISDGESVRVVGIDRLMLLVEPEAGGARDYRER